LYSRLISPTRSNLTNQSMVIGQFVKQGKKVTPESTLFKTKSEVQQNPL